MDDIIKEKEAFNGITDGYNFIGTFLSGPEGDAGNALIEIKKDGKLVKEFLFPAYKIWNIAAHAQDIVDGLKKDSDSGLYVAGSDGLGGNAYSATGSTGGMKP